MQINLELDAAEVSDPKQLADKLTNEISANSKRDVRGLPVFSHAVRDAENQFGVIWKILSALK